MASVVPASISSSPAAGSGATLARRVLNYVSAITDDELEALALEAVNSALADINTRAWNKIYAKTTLTLTADDADYGLPADFKEPMSLMRLDTGGNRSGRITFIPAQMMWNERAYATSSGEPTRYTVDYKARQTILSVAPTTAYVASYPTLEQWYFRRIAEFTQGSSSSGIDQEFDWYLIWKARAELAAALDPAKAQFADSNAGRRWGALIRNDVEQQSDWSEV